MSFERFDAAVRAVAQSVDFARDDPVTATGVVPLSSLGRRVALVELGDLTDRGPDSFTCFKIATSIEAAIGWKLIQLLGNHEAYLHRHVQTAPAFTGIYEASLADFGGAERMRALWSDGGDLWRHVASRSLVIARIGSPVTAAEYVVDPAHSPDSLFVHADLEGAWVHDFLRDFRPRQDTLLTEMERIKSDDAYFVLEAAYTGMLTAQIRPAAGWESLVARFNQWAREKLVTGAADSERVESPGGPVDTRRHVYDTPAPICEEVAELLEIFRVSRIIVGHTPQANRRVAPKCGGTFIVADVEMSRGFRSRPGMADGQPMALVLTNNADGRVASVVAHYTHPAGGYSGSDPVYPL